MIQLQLKKAPFHPAVFSVQALETNTAVREGDHGSDSGVWDGELVHLVYHVRLDAHHLGRQRDNERV